MGLEVDVPDPGEAIDPNDPGARMNAFCINSREEGVKLPREVGPEERICPFSRKGAWKCLGRWWDPGVGWETELTQRCGKAWAVFGKSKECWVEGAEAGNGK